MADKQPSSRPWWVRVTLWGLPNRASALFCVWLCVGIALGSVFLGFRHWWFSFGAVAILGALGYLWAVRWVDEHGGWR
jgi:hypothetical protein